MTVSLKDSGKVPRDKKDFRLIHYWHVFCHWRKFDTPQWMREATATYLAPRLALWASIAVVALHWWWAAISGVSLNFARGGALVVLISAVSYGWFTWHLTNVAIPSGGPVRRFSLFDPYFMLPLLGVVGTILWGYGDLVPFA